MKATILALGLYESSGGPAKSVRRFAEALDASVISWVDQAQARNERLIWKNTCLVRGHTSPILRRLLWPLACDLPAAERLVAESDVVSVHSFWRWHCPWLAGVAAACGTPYWFVPHGALDPYAFESDRVFKRLFLHLPAARFLEDATTIVCATAGEAAKIRRLLPKASCTIIPWPLDDADFRHQDDASRLAHRRRLGIGEDEFCLLFFGRLDPMKRPLDTIGAFAAAGLPDAHLVMMGPEFGVTFEQCRERARDLGVAQRVHVVGPQYGPDRLGLIDASDVYVSLSHRENFNFTALECLASGLPVILGSGNDIGSDLQGVGCGWMLPEGGDAPAVIAAAYVAGRDARLAMGAAGRDWAKSHLRYERFADRIHALAETVAARRT